MDTLSDALPHYSTFTVDSRKFLNSQEFWDRYFWGFNISVVDSLFFVCWLSTRSKWCRREPHVFLIHGSLYALFSISVTSEFLVFTYFFDFRIQKHRVAEKPAMEFMDMGWCLQNTVLYRFVKICTVHSYLAVAQHKRITYHILIIFLRRDTNARTPMLCILKQRCMYIHLPSFPLICTYTVLNTSIIAQSDGGHKYIWQLRGSRLLLNFSTHCFSSYFLFFWAEVRSRHYICGTVMSRWETSQPTKVWTPMPGQKEPWFFCLLFQKKDGVLNSHFGMEKLKGISF